MFVLNSDITIGQFTRVKPHSVKITKSIFQFVDKAVINLPITARIIKDGVVETASAETAKQFKEGDKVLIKLGYNGVLNEEFEGFVSRINFSEPLELECEGYSYQLRKNSYRKTFVNAELIDVLKFLIADTDIVLDKKNIPGFPIDKIVFKGENGTEALEMIKKVSDNTIRLFFTGKLLYAGLQYLQLKPTVKYRLGWNVIKDGNLKLREAKNRDVTVHFVGEKKDGTKTKVTIKNKSFEAANKVTIASAGSTGEVLVIKSHGVHNEIAGKQIAEAKLQQLTFNGYEGKITAFGTPYCEPGYRAIIEDKKYQERGGNYIVEHTEVSYGMGGFRRVVGIGAKL